jgi:predicted O-methyltransferase YrrM
MKAVASLSLSDIFKVIASLDTNREHLNNNWCIGEQTGRLLYLMAQTSGAKSVLEIGTSIGYSTLWLAAGVLGNNGHIHTLDASAERQQEAKQHFTDAGVSSIITCHTGDALALLDVLGAQNHQTDLVFMDAAKKEYWAYVQKILPMMPSGGLLLADNTHSHSEQMADFLTGMAGLDGQQLDTTLIDHAGELHGVLLARKR